MTGTGTRTGLQATPGAVSFGTVPDGVSQPENVTIANSGTAPATVGAPAAPAAPFAITGLPPAGTVLQPGASVVATATYKPTGTGPDSGSAALTVTGSGAGPATLTLPLTGTGTPGVSQLTPAPAAVNFGPVPVGQQATATVDVPNGGNLPAIITGTTAPPVPFGAPDQVAAGLPVNPGYDLEIPLTFSPSSTGPVAASYRITWTDALGSHALTVPVTGTGTAASAGTVAVPPPGGGWTLNGSARMSGASLRLTQAAARQAGTAVYSVPERSNGLTATFRVQIGGGSGADGLTFSLLDAARASARSAGRSGGSLGSGGLPGVAVALDTAPGRSFDSPRFAGVATSSSGGQLRWVQRTGNIPRLRTGSGHVVGVSVSGQRLTVTLDGRTVLSPTLPPGTVPPSALVAFTGGTGSGSDVHTVTNAVIAAGGSGLPGPGGGWGYNGSAALTGSDSVLTGAVPAQAGSVVDSRPVRTDGLHVRFDAQLSGGTGAEGLTFALLNPARAGVTALGRGGNELGFGGLAGVAVTLITHQDTGYPAANFIGVSSTARNGRLRFRGISRAIGPLRSGTQALDVRVTGSAGGSVLVVFLNGQQVLQTAVPMLTRTSLLAFTAATSSGTDVHAVRDVAMSAAG